MNIFIVIGTRPQYIKLKPLYDYCINKDIPIYIIDTNQHYSDDMSIKIIDELRLKIDFNLHVDFIDELSFIRNSFFYLQQVFNEFKIGKEDMVLVLGDTNSTLVASLISKKMGMRLGHIEAGIRCGDKNRPEEINRIVVDSISDIHFTSREKDNKNVSYPVYIGDLEYYFLHTLQYKYKYISYDGPIILTIHRQENMEHDRLQKIFDFCRKIPYQILFPIHHRTQKYTNNLKIVIPNNIEVISPLSFFEMMDKLIESRGVITDSGGLTKIVPFFGKKCIVPLFSWEWEEVFNYGYATNQMDENWFDNCQMKRNVNLYYNENSCKIIMNNIL